MANQIFDTITKLIQIDYIKAILILAVFIILSKTAVKFLERIMLRLTRKTKTKIDDLIVAKTHKPLSFIFMLIGVRIALIPLQLKEKINIIIGKTISSVIVLIIIYLLIVIFSILIDAWGKRMAAKTKSKPDKQLINLSHKVVKVIVLICGLLFIMDIWEIQIGPFLAGLGIAGIAVAFALQNTLANLFGGISLIIDKSIKVGDTVKLDEQTKGTVLDIGLRSTKIRTFDNEVVIIPNGKVADSKILSYVKPDLSARLVISFSAAYGSDIDKVKKVVLKEIRKIKQVMKEPVPFIRFTEMADSALVFNAYMWVEDYSTRFGIKDKVNTLIYNALNKAKINIPFPQMDVHLKKR